MQQLSVLQVIHEAVVQESAAFELAEAEIAVPGAAEPEDVVPVFVSLYMEYGFRLICHHLLPFVLQRDLTIFLNWLLQG